MHRMPLLMATPSIFWRRDYPEWYLFEKTLNKVNVDETNSFLAVLDSEAEFYKSHCYGMAEDVFTTAQRYLSDKSYKTFAEGMFFISYLILRTPKDSPILSKALKMRGGINYHNCFFEQASRDYEMYLEVYKTIKVENEELCEVYGHLVICMYMMKKLSEARRYLRLYKKLKAKLVPNILQQPNFEIIDNHIKEFKNEFDNTENTVQKFKEDECKGIPYNGFTSCSEIPAASSTCFYHNDGIYVKDDIDEASVLFIEEPIFKSINVPLLDCEVCYKHSSEQMYTCLECRYKSYCSLPCLEKDKAEHKDECLGYGQLTLLMLDASSIFRAFVRISNQLHEKIFNSQLFRKLIKAEDVWKQLLELINNIQTKDIGDLTLIKTKPYYSRLNEMRYSTLVATAFRLTIFIERNTDLIDKFYKILNISNKQKLILIGSILMRIHCNILLNSFDFEINRALKTDNINQSLSKHFSMMFIEQMMQSINRRHCFIKSINNFYDINIKKDIWQRSERIITAKKNVEQMAFSDLTVIRHVKSCEPIHRLLSTYKDSIAELYFQSEPTKSNSYLQHINQPSSSTSSKILCRQIADMSDIERYTFVKNFARLFHIKYVEYFSQSFHCEHEVKQVLTLYCPTLAKFKHSCEPNVEVIVLDNGVVVGKSLRKIKNGEQLYVCYKANYGYHYKVERRRFLDQLNLDCKCKYCKMKELNEPANLRVAIFCESCEGAEITPNHIVCSSCNAQYSNLFNKYRTIIYRLENQMKIELRSGKSTERDIYILHLILYSYSKLYFTPQNEFRIAIELRMAYFFAVQNFAKQSYDLIQETRNVISKFYDEHLVWFTFYAEMLQIIKIILFTNVEDGLLILPMSDLDDLCSLGLYIAKGQKYYIEFYEIFDEECSNVLEDIKVLLKWKDKIICSEFSPLAHCLKTSHRGSRKKKFKS